MRPIGWEHFQARARYWTRSSANSPSVSWSHAVLHLFQPKPRRFLARIRWRRTFFSTHCLTKAKHRLAPFDVENAGVPPGFPLGSDTVADDTPLRDGLVSRHGAGDPLRAERRR